MATEKKTIDAFDKLCCDLACNAYALLLISRGAWGEGGGVESAFSVITKRCRVVGLSGTTVRSNPLQSAVGWCQLLNYGTAHSCRRLIAAVFTVNFNPASHKQGSCELKGCQNRTSRKAIGMRVYVVSRSKTM